MSLASKLVTPRKAAWRDVDAALDHYEISAGEETARAFLAAIEGAFAHVSQFPGSGSPRYAHALGLPDLRSWPLKRFPYLVFYLERDDHIDVWRVLRMEQDIANEMGEGEAGAL